MQWNLSSELNWILRATIIITDPFGTPLLNPLSQLETDYDSLTTPINRIVVPQSLRKWY